jgi:hypothetical protein
MRTFILAACMTLVAFPAAAISRYNSESLSCARVHAIIRSEGAAIMRYPSKFTGNILYDRYVADSRFCVSGKYAQSTTIPTADRANCPVYRCADIQYDEFD